MEIKKRAIIRPHFDQKTQQRIDKLVLYLQSKGRDESTKTTYQKKLYTLHKVFDLNGTQAFELTIANYVKIDGYVLRKLRGCYARYCKFYNLLGKKLNENLL